MKLGCDRFAHEAIDNASKKRTRVSKRVSITGFRPMLRSARRVDSNDTAWPMIGDVVASISANFQTLLSCR